MDLGDELAALQEMCVSDLRAKYTDLFDTEPNTKNRTWLVRRLAWRIQALAEGTLTERALQRAAELANESDIRLRPPRVRVKPTDPSAPPLTATTTARQQPDGRLPPPGTVLTREYKGQTLQVRILPAGFEYEGKVYGSLTAVAKKITGSHCNGFLFFRLIKKGGDA